MKRLFMAMALMASFGAMAQTPSDTFGSGAVLGLAGGVVTGSTGSATAQLGEAGISQVSYGRSVWWRIDLANTTRFNARTQGSNFDTTLAVFKGANMTEALVVAANDDNGSGGQWSEVDVTLPPGSYYVALDGFNSAGGNYTLSWQMQEQGGNPGAAPANNSFAASQEIPARDEGNVVKLNNRLATVEAGEPGAGSRSLWYSYTAPRLGTYRIAVIGSQFDSVLHVYTGNSLASLTQLATGDDIDNPQGNRESATTVSVAAGQVLRIRVASFGAPGDSTFGDATLSITSPKQTEIPGINSTYSGLWGDPTADNGQGVMIEIARHPDSNNPNQLLFFTWYLYDPQGAASFITGNAEITPTQGVLRSAIPINAIIARGVPLGAPPAPGTTVRSPWGTITLSFRNCNRIDMTYTPSVTGWGPTRTVQMRRAIPRGLGSPCS